jgi:hypothetical protein
VFIYSSSVLLTPISGNGPCFIVLSPEELHLSSETLYNVTELKWLAVLINLYDYLTW